jgi:hypothetical protein
MEQEREGNRGFYRSWTRLLPFLKKIAKLHYQGMGMNEELGIKN